MRLFVIAAFFVAGVAAALELTVTLPWPVFWLWTVAACAALGWAAIAFRPAAYPSVLLLALLAGLVIGRPSVEEFAAPPPQVASGREVEFEGLLLADPRPWGSAVRLDLTDIVLVDDGIRLSLPDQRISVIATRLFDSGSGESASRGRRFQYGDRYLVSGFFTPAAPSSGEDTVGFVYRSTVRLVAAGDGSTLRRTIGRWRSHAAGSQARVLPEPVAGLIAGVTVGDRLAIAPDVRDAFRNAGVAHVLAISGLHVGLVALPAAALAAWAFGRRRHLYLAAPFAAVWFYAAMAGFSPSVTRAGIMVTIYLLARALGRQSSIVPAVGAAAAVMVAIEPAIIRSLSFQLSFAAVIGIAALAPPLKRWADAALESHSGSAGLLRPLSGGVAVSIAATLATAPLVMLRFEEVPLWSAPATLLIAPALPVMIVSGAAIAITELVSPGLAGALAWPAWLAGHYAIGVARFFDGLPVGPIYASGWTSGAAWMSYSALLLILLRRQARQLIGRTWTAARAVREWLQAPPPPAVAIRRLWVYVALAAAALMWTGVAGLPDGRLSVTFFETERGDVILVETPNGQEALIDGGSTPMGAVRSIGSRLPFWDRSLGLVVLTHPHADHLEGLAAVLDRYTVDVVLDAPVEYETALYQEWLAITAMHPGRVNAVPGMIIALDDEVMMTVLGAGEAPWSSDPVNDASVVLLLRYREVAVLLTGDMTSQGELRLLRDGADVTATVLLAGHHGSRDSTSAPFIEAVSPAVAVISAGHGNRYGHPHEETLDRLAAGAPHRHVFITKEHGDVTISTDGHRLWVETAR